METAKWRAGQFIYTDKIADPNMVAQEILSIGDNASPQEIVEKARDTSTELHKCFDWNDSIAGEKWRLEQARKITYFLVIQEEQIPENRPEIRYFMKPKKQEGYKPTEIVIKVQDEYQALLTQAWAELQIFKKKYECLKELQEIFDLIE